MNQLYRLRSFAAPYWRPALGAVVTLVLMVVLDLAIPRLIQRLIDQGVARGDQPLIIRTALLMLGISLMSTILAIANSVTSIRVGEGLARDLRRALFLKIQSFSYGNLNRSRTGELLVRLTSDIAAIKNVTQISLRIGSRAPLMMIGSAILMVNTNAALALTMLPLLLVTVALIALFIARIEALYRGLQQKLDALNNVLQENIAGVRLVKAFVRAGFEGGRFAGANQDLSGQSATVMKFSSLMSPLLTLCVNIGLVIVIWSGGLRAISGGMSTGQILAFTNYLLTTMAPLIFITLLSTTWAAGAASATRVNALLDTRLDIQDPATPLGLPVNGPGRVVFELVGFSYQLDQNGRPDDKVLDDVNLVIEPGQTTAVLGATGAGKSTLINLVPRFYDVTSGRITLDGVDIRQLSHDTLLSQIGIVPQETILFSGSVRDNIRYGRPDASDEDVLAAAQAAQADDFVQRLPQGYDTRVEQRGINLSGGQKQRLAIARALLLRPKILILDDSTSAVDVATETHIQEALAVLMRGRTVLLVAQRMSTVLNADKIIVIDKGRVAAQGTHKTLLQSSPIYREIYESQLGAALVDASGAAQAVVA